VAGCGKRYTDPSSLRKHAKNHTDLGNGFPGPENRLNGGLPCRTSANRRNSSSSSISSVANGGYQQQAALGTRNPSISSDYGSQKDALDVFDEIDLQPYPATVSPRFDQVPNNMDDGHEYIPYESVARFLVDERSQFGLDSIGESTLTLTRATRRDDLAPTTINYHEPGDCCRGRGRGRGRTLRWLRYNPMARELTRVSDRGLPSRAVMGWT
jgi:hypothetical protein